MWIPKAKSDSRGDCSMAPHTRKRIALHAEAIATGRIATTITNLGIFFCGSLLRGVFWRTLIASYMQGKHTNLYR